MTRSLSKDSTLARPEHANADEAQETELKKQFHENERGPQRIHEEIP